MWLGVSDAAIVDCSLVVVDVEIGMLVTLGVCEDVTITLGFTPMFSLFFELLHAEIKRINMTQTGITIFLLQCRTHF